MFRPNRYGCILFLTLAFAAVAAQAQAYRYRYISLDEVRLPSGFVDFLPVAINDSGRIFGTARDASFVPHVAVYEGGAVIVLQPGRPVIVNARGTIGGSVTNPQTGKSQAALFRGTKVELIPLLPGDTQTSVVSLNDSDTALVWSQDPSGLNRNTYRLYSKGETIFRFQLPTGSDCTRCWGVNNQGIVVGIIYDANLNAFRAIRFRSPYGEPLVLDPLPTDSQSTSFAINNRGDILGVSNVFLGDPTRSHYGVWDRNGNFKTYFEGTTYFALFNGRNLIVLTENLDTDFNSYLVPRPGVRLNLESLLDNPTSVEAPLAQVIDINNRGDMIGYGLCTSFCPKFLLRRLGSSEGKW
jgi:hypothetical protein